MPIRLFCCIRNVVQLENVVGYSYRDVKVVLAVEVGSSTMMALR